MTVGSTVDKVLEKRPIMAGAITELLGAVGWDLLQPPVLDQPLVIITMLGAAGLGILSRKTLHQLPDLNRIAKGLCLGAAISLTATAGLEESILLLTQQPNHLHAKPVRMQNNPNIPLQKQQPG